MFNVNIKALCLSLLVSNLTFNGAFAIVLRHQQKVTVETMYGSTEVTEPVLIELFNKQLVLERIKHVRQYGARDYVMKPLKEYTRFDHCVGVFFVLRLKGASLIEQIAGLLHDVSHTVFSHTGDVLFGQKTIFRSYQDDNHEMYLKAFGIDTLLARYGISLDSIIPEKSQLTMLDCPLPDICADRLEYNLHAGILTSMLTMPEIHAILNDVQFEHGKWVFTNTELAKKLALVSLYNTENVWSSAEGYVYEYTWLAGAIKRALEIGWLTTDDIHYSVDDLVWGRLMISNDPLIAQNLDNIIRFRDIIQIVPVAEAEIVAQGKFRGIDPLIKTGVGLKRLTELDGAYKKEYERVRSVMANGRGIRLCKQESGKA
jgi:uncharacterized protein